MPTFMESLNDFGKEYNGLLFIAITLGVLVIALGSLSSMVLMFRRWRFRQSKAYKALLVANTGTRFRWKSRWPNPVKNTREWVNGQS